MLGLLEVLVGLQTELHWHLSFQPSFIQRRIYSLRCLPFQDTCAVQGLIEASQVKDVENRPKRGSESLTTVYDVAVK